MLEKGGCRAADIASGPRLTTRTANRRSGRESMGPLLFTALLAKSIKIRLVSHRTVCLLPRNFDRLDCRYVYIGSLPSAAPKNAAGSPPGYVLVLV